MTPFEVYKTYLSIKNHFTKDKYDYHKYCGKTNASIIRAGYKQKLELIVASKKPSRKTAVNVMTVDDF